ncbi:hypothetical protein [Flectobacillus sp. BAB-3569]|uniref:hypothetical protein n=1 Tax=Flectobacillus sp. BAB-3569 TaxID=1509483 RepID=UPI000BA40529|nr:hypothetical protein [Flectobacillus sp. BAB-3569]PAC24832.1 hypothetical protein BWI92_26785 [Flectobacillus sp. BAB-3569]
MIDCRDALATADESTFDKAWTLRAGETIYSSDPKVPQNVKYDPAIPTPQQYFGFQVGEWHIQHEQLVDTEKSR